MPSFISARIPVRMAWLIAVTLLFSFSSFAQLPTCTFNSTANSVHQEGLAERVGNITVTCSGGTVGATVSIQLFISLNANITNRVDANGAPTGIAVTGASPGTISLTSATTLNFNSTNYTVTAAPTVITISGIRVAVASLSNGSAPSTVIATLAGIGGAQFPVNFQVIVAIAQPTLLASLVNNGVPCGGSAPPATLDFPTIASTSVSSTLRITEATSTSFTPKDAGADNGMRILVKISGYGSGASVYVPDAIVGNDGSTPTSAGAFASSIFAGSYTPGGAGQLLLIRVNGADSNGAGGTLAIPQPVAAATFGTVTQVPLTNGNGTVAYEVVDANANFQESAQIPVFVVVPQTSCPTTLTPALSVQLAPVSTVSVDTTPISLTGSSLGGVQSASVKTGNLGSGMLNFTTSIAYQSGSGWLSVSPASGVNNVTLQVIANPMSLAPGTYNATVTVSAAPYGMGTIPVTFVVGPPGVTLQNVGNAASYQYGTVAPGSYAVLFGLNLSGTNVGVTFNGLPATIVYKSATQINVIVPAALGAQQAAGVVVTVDGNLSNSFKVGLALNAPGVFNPGIVNPDGSVNSATHPAARGNFVSIYLTGLSLVGGNTTGVVTANFGTLMNQSTLFAGAQPTYPALDQVNVTVPASLPSTPNPVQVQICIPGSTGQQVCSNQAPLYIQ